MPVGAFGRLRLSLSFLRARIIHSLAYTSQNSGETVNFLSRHIVYSDYQSPRDFTRSGSGLVWCVCTLLHDWVVARDATVERRSQLASGQSKPDFADAIVYGMEGPEALISSIRHLENEGTNGTTALAMLSRECLRCSNSRGLISATGIS